MDQEVNKVSRVIWDPKDRKVHKGKWGLLEMLVPEVLLAKAVAQELQVQLVQVDLEEKQVQEEKLVT